MLMQHKGKIDVESVLANKSNNSVLEVNWVVGKSVTQPIGLASLMYHWRAAHVVC